MTNYKKLKPILFMFASLIVCGVIGYMILLDLDVVTSLYMTVITISTVGYKEVAPLNDVGKIFSMILIFWGIGTVGYTFSTLAMMVADGDIRELWRRKSMEKQLKNIRDHYIVCGGGETSEVILKKFIKAKVDVILIEKHMDENSKLLDLQIPTIHGDALEEEVLKRAHIEDAKGLITNLPTDADNIMVTLSARNLNPKLHIISKAIDPKAPEKLKKVGADQTISMNEIGGRRMAALMLQPNIVNFLDVVTRVGDMELGLHEVVVQETSSLAGLTLLEAQIPQKVGVMVLAVKEKDTQRLLFNPSSTYVIEAGDILLSLGTEEQEDQLNILARG